MISVPKRCKDNKEKKRQAPQKFYKHAWGREFGLLDHVSIDPAPNIDNVALFKARYNPYDYEISIIRLDSSVCKLSSIN